MIGEVIENTRSTVSQADEDRPELLPVEVEVYIDPDGAVVFADLEASLVSVAESLECPTEAELDGKEYEVRE